MKSRSGILAGGNWIVDKVKLIDTYPQQDALTNIRSETISNGGSPFNVLADLARLGAAFPLAAVGLVGDDAEGAWVRGECGRYDIDATQLHTHPSAQTSYTDVMTVQANGRRTFFHQRGANAFLDVEHFDFRASEAKIFHLGYLLLLDRLDMPDAEHGTVAARVLQRARAAGFKTSVDVVSEDSQRFAAVVKPALAYVDYCILNEFELERTTGIPTRTGDKVDLTAIKAAAEQLLDAGVKEWVIVHFPEGACAIGEERKFTVQGSVRIPPADIVGTVGAGDAFAAGVLYGFHDDAPVETALEYGVCAAAACLYGAGTSDAMRPMPECRGLGEKFGFRTLA